jgi:hypothetical protein
LWLGFGFGFRFLILFRLRCHGDVLIASTWAGPASDPIRMPAPQARDRGALTAS